MEKIKLIFNQSLEESEEEIRDLEEEIRGILEEVI